MTTNRPSGLRQPPILLIATVWVGAGALLWMLSEWSWFVPALALVIAVGVALVSRVLSVLLPREGGWIGDRGGLFAAVGALGFLVAQSTIWAVLLALGLAGIAVGTWQRRKIRWVLLGLSSAVALVGAVGLIVQAAGERANIAAAHREAGDRARAQLLPDSPDDALVALMDAAARPGQPDCFLFTEAGLRSLAETYGATGCVEALGLAGRDVVDRDAYGYRVDRESLVVQEAASGAVSVDGCAVTWRPTFSEILNGRDPATVTPGPSLAQVVVVPVQGGTGWAIEEITPCP